jgi:hypothetical protein
MKKSQTVSLILITASLAACNSAEKQQDWSSTQGGRTYLRADTTAPYSHHRAHFGGGPLMYYMAFRAMYGYNNGLFGGGGYHSNCIHSSSNYGTNTAKQNIVRGGFGRSGHSVSS